MYDILTVYLENGLRVIMHRIPYVRTMACGIWLRQGSMHEDDMTNGLSHLLEHLMINKENTSNPKLGELMYEVSNEGVVYNAGTTKENTLYYFTGLSRTLEKCLQTLSGMIVDNKSFNKNLFENEKKVVVQEAISYYSSFNQIKERSSQALWGNTGVGRIIVGGIENVRNAKIENIEEIIDKAYTPENATLVVIGGIDYHKTLDIITENFSRWKDKETRKYKEIVESEPGIYFNKTENGKSSVISICFRIPAYNDGDRHNIEIMSKILGDPGLESRLVQEIRIKRGLAYTIGGFTSFYGSRGTLGFTAVCEHESVNEVISIMMEEFKRAKETGFTDEEITRAKRKLETRTLLELDNMVSQLKFLGKCSSYGHLFSLEQEVRDIQRLERNKINLTIQDIFKEENMGLATIGNFDIDNVLQLLTFN
ncbi:M16 family metallopeptidase [Wukongibacter sp. M2B1]|uniref:M16 family metallopeptidase n=1 Tax=Wukongibacter sp. M2B1 TaxID=3088895 RepID=UPI003D7B8F35